MSGQHTPGKLNPCKAIKLDGVYYSDGKTPCWEADVECEQGSAIYAITYGKNAEQAEARARLIAAAPDLLEALEDAREALHFHYVEWDGEPEDAVPLQLARSKCDAAIAKARGQS